ncbi:hypothetical protein SRABI118_03964 [Massilia sp. Bi118]|uniref:hypothetical protein n=1 Tax=Massilia sp. Bi118 TaxID=2822346 RepID=UPI001DEF4135|nr:hypothetical protein [Massilia sp. Bi118]CAH0287255.1 hypothetical protein SRABI118_03964 [Massilia sp. Bi118]
MKEKEKVRRFGYYEERSNRSLDFHVYSQVWTPENLEEFEKITSTIFVLQPVMVAEDVVEKNYQSIFSSSAVLTEQINTAKSQVATISELSMHGLVNAVQTVTNFLASASAFLAQTETRIGRTFGKDSKQAKIWNESRRSEHASKFGYRFMYELRNFSQHLSLPISNFGLFGERGAEGAPMSFSVGLTLERAPLLDSGFNWKNLRVEIAALSDEFLLVPLIDEYLQSIRELCLKALDLFDQEIATSVDYMAALQRIFRVPPTAIPALFICEAGALSQPPASHEQVPVVQLAYLLKRRTALTELCRREHRPRNL